MAGRGLAQLLGRREMDEAVPNVDPVNTPDASLVRQSGAGTIL
jgi:hypothetical protein